MAERRPNSHQRSWMSWPEPVWTRKICIWPAYGTSFPWIFPWILADFARLTTIGSHQRRAFGGSEPVLSIAVATDSRFCDLESFTVAFFACLTMRCWWGGLFEFNAGNGGSNQALRFQSMAWPRIRRCWTDCLAGNPEVTCCYALLFSHVFPIRDARS